jgi:hypothetical protein
MTSSHLMPAPCQWFSRLASALDPRSAPRLALLFLGAVFARDRRTVTTWIRAAKLSDQFRPCYTAVAAAGKRAARGDREARHSHLLRRERDREPPLGIGLEHDVANPGRKRVADLPGQRADTLSRPCDLGPPTESF